MWWWLVAGVLLIVVWIGINVSVLRSRSDDTPHPPAGDEARISAGSRGRAHEPASLQLPGDLGRFDGDAASRTAPGGPGLSMQDARGARASAAGPAWSDGKAPGHETPNLWEDAASSMHAVSDAAVLEPEADPSRARRVFHERRERFVWHRSRVHVLADERWRALFEWLCDAPEVLGWIAFEDDTVGASDRSYDDALVSVLLEHRRSVERVRQEVGLSEVSEWLIHGAEGTVGVLSAPDGVWLAVFVDAGADVSALGTRLSAYLQAPERTV